MRHIHSDRVPGSSLQLAYGQIKCANWLVLGCSKSTVWHFSGKIARAKHAAIAMCRRTYRRSAIPRLSEAEDTSVLSFTIMTENSQENYWGELLVLQFWSTTGAFRMFFKFWGPWHVDLPGWIQRWGQGSGPLWKITSYMGKYRIKAIDWTPSWLKLDSHLPWKMLDPPGTVENDSFLWN